MSEAILITGGNGYLGQRLAEALLRSSDTEVLLFMHASNAAELNDKSVGIRERLAEFESSKQLKICGGELRDAEPFAAVHSKGIHRIVHSAAITRFNVDEELANSINVQGSKHLLAFAKKCADLQSLEFLSTVYASGLRTGIIREAVLDRASEFSNHYEKSKWESEQLVSNDFSELPVNIVRIATLIADNDSGVVSQQNAFHNTLKLFYYGLLSLFPGEKETPIYFVTGDFVLQSLMAILESKQVGNIYHVCHQLNETANLEQLVDLVFDTFAQYKDFKIRQVLKPLWSDAESFDLLSQGIASMSSGVMAQAVSSVSPFSRQLFAAKDFRNDNLRNLDPSYKAPDPLQLIASTARYLADTKWGRQLQNAK